MGTAKSRMQVCEPRKLMLEKHIEIALSILFMKNCPYDSVNWLAEFIPVGFNIRVTFHNMS